MYQVNDTISNIIRVLIITEDHVSPIKKETRVSKRQQVGKKREPHFFFLPPDDKVDHFTFLLFRSFLLLLFNLFFLFLLSIPEFYYCVTSDEERGRNGCLFGMEIMIRNWKKGGREMRKEEPNENEWMKG